MGDPHYPVHNRRQREYFERTLKATMVPRDTPYIRRHVDEMLRRVAPRPGERVLEVGCGMGRHALLMAARGIRLEGLELSPVLLDQFRMANGGRYDIPLHCADILHPPQHLEGQFDVVVGFFMLHHLPDLAAGMRAIASVLKPRGRAAFIEPNPINPFYYLQIIFTPNMRWREERGILQMRSAVMGLAMRQAGLEPTPPERFGFFPPAVANRAWGARLEAVLERQRILRPWLPFQVFAGTRAASGAS